MTLLFSASSLKVSRPAKQGKRDHNNNNNNNKNEDNNNKNNNKWNT